MKRSASSGIHVCEPAFEWMEAILNTKFRYVWYLHFESHMYVTLPSVDIVCLLGDLTEPAVTIAGIGRFYWNVAIYLRLDVTLLLPNSVKIRHRLYEL